MSQLLGTVLASQITTGDTANTFSIGDTNLMQGGHHSVTYVEERDAITGERRRVGMTCWVAGTVNALFRLTGGTLNSDWLIDANPRLSTLPDVYIPLPTAQQVLAFDGSLWIAADAPSTVAPSAFTYYLDSTPAGTLGYQSLATTPATGAEEVNSVVITTGSGLTQIPSTHLSPYLNRTRIDAGIWEFNIYGGVDTASATVVAVVSSLDIAGAETELFRIATADYTTDPQLTTTITTQGSHNAQLTDKILARFYGTTQSASPVTVSIYHNGTAHYTHFHTPLSVSHNDLGGLQGGASGQYYHTTLNQNAALIGTGNAPSAVNPFVTQDTLTTEAGTRALRDQELQNQIGALSTTAPAFPDVGNRLVSGGNAVWVSGYHFRVEPTIVEFSGTPASFAQSDVYLAASDPVDNRLDLIVADRVQGTVIPITGTASTPPAPPDYDPLNQLQLTFIPVDAASLQPSNISRTWIYRENAEWAFNGNVTVNPASAVSPFEGSLCIEGTNVLNNQYFRMSAPTPFDVALYDTLYFYIKPKAGWGTRYLRLHWENAGGTRQGNYFSLANSVLGFDINNLNYQLVAIPMRLFSIPGGTLVQRLRFTTISTSGSMGYYIDDIAIQLGVVQPPLPVPDATTTTKGIVLLAVDGATGSNVVVQGNDFRLALAQSAWVLAQNGTTAVIVEQGTRSSKDQDLQNQITAEAGTRVGRDTYLQTEIDSIFATLGIGFSGTFALFMAQTRNGPPDTQVNVINGVVAGQTESYFVWDDFDGYSAGSVTPSTLNRGSSWNGAGVVFTDSGTAMKAEDQQNYTTGTVVGVGTLNGGTGWSTAAIITVPYYTMVGTEVFETYALGTVYGGSYAGTLDGGFGWTGTTVIYSY